jgi:hypothetical protein
MSSGSQPGERRGDRAPGTPNKRTAELVERLAELECDPVEGLVRIAADPNTDAALRARVYADLLPYLYPKRKAVEVNGEQGGPIVVCWANVEFVRPGEVSPDPPLINAA